MSKRDEPVVDLVVTDKRAMSQLDSEGLVPARPTSGRRVTILEAGGLLPAEQLAPALAEYDKTRSVFFEWLMSHLKIGVHYGYAPGTTRKLKDGRVVSSRGESRPDEWIAKPGLYQSGADLIMDLLKLAPEFELDEQAYKALQLKPGDIAMRAYAVSKETGERIPAVFGQAIFMGIEKKMPAHSRLLMARKRARVNLALEVVPGLRDFFTQDTEEPGFRGAEDATRGKSEPEKTAEREDNQREGDLQPRAQKAIKLFAGLGVMLDEIEGPHGAGGPAAGWSDLTLDLLVNLYREIKAIPPADRPAAIKARFHPPEDDDPGEPPDFDEPPLPDHDREPGEEG